MMLNACATDSSEDLDEVEFSWTGNPPKLLPYQLPAPITLKNQEKIIEVTSVKFAELKVVDDPIKGLTEWNPPIQINKSNIIQEVYRVFYALLDEISCFKSPTEEFPVLNCLTRGDQVLGLNLGLWIKDKSGKYVKANQVSENPVGRTKYSTHWQ